MLRQHWLIYVMTIPAIVLLILFNFLPMWGVSIAFVDYKPAKAMADQVFVGLKYFQQILTLRESGVLLRNTLVIAIGKIILGQVSALIFALLLHEVAARRFKKLVQTLTSLPHFLSWVIIGGIMIQILASVGPVNQGLNSLFGVRPVRFLGDPGVYTWTILFSHTWKEFGFGAIIYLAALTAISPDLYEAAAVDGAGRGARLLHVTLPGIVTTIILLSCLSLGSVLEAGFEQLLVLTNPVVSSTGDIIDTYVYRVGLIQANFSLATAVGLIKSLVGMVLVVVSYWLAARLANYRIF